MNESSIVQSALMSEKAACDGESLSRPPFASSAGAAPARTTPRNAACRAQWRKTSRKKGITHVKKRKKHPIADSRKTKKGVGLRKIYKHDWALFQPHRHLLCPTLRMRTTGSTHTHPHVHPRPHVHSRLHVHPHPHVLPRPHTTHASLHPPTCVTSAPPPTCVPTSTHTRPVRTSTHTYGRPPPHTDGHPPPTHLYVHPHPSAPPPTCALTSTHAHMAVGTVHHRWRCGCVVL